MNNRWYMKYPNRFKSEIWLMTEYTNAKLISTHNGLLRWIEPIVNNFGQRFLIGVTYPIHFPTQLAWASILSPTIIPDLKYHLFPEGRICVISPEQYTPDITALVIRNQACTWAFYYGLYLSYDKWYGPESNIERSNCHERDT
ncbi:MAG: hypothetical protein HOC71_02570 [Candidatus Latescibacteria bacterium]|jgi:hypothetical protein|nr:hypothetical protein [Candidatus Latescibacterota bacterium]